eukprot:358273-Chlamydomonas_euryale.AAC.6
MVLPGVDSSTKATPSEIAAHTVAALRRTVPAAIPGVMFLSGGQSEEEATVNLNAINAAACTPGTSCPWSLSFSYGRALQHSVLELWAKEPARARDAQALLAAVAAANSAASKGEYAGVHPVAGGGSLAEGFRGWRA